MRENRAAWKASCKGVVLPPPLGPFALVEVEYLLSLNRGWTFWSRRVINMRRPSITRGFVFCGLIRIPCTVSRMIIAHYNVSVHTGAGTNDYRSRIIENSLSFSNGETLRTIICTSMSRERHQQWQEVICDLHSCCFKRWCWWQARRTQWLTDCDWLSVWVNEWINETKSLLL